MNFHNFLFVFWGGGGIFTDWHCTVLFLTMSQHVFAPFGRPSFWTLLLRIIRIRVLIIQNGKKTFFLSKTCDLSQTLFQIVICNVINSHRKKLNCMKLFLASLWAFDLSNIMKKYCNEKVLQWIKNMKINWVRCSVEGTFSSFSILIFIPNFGWVIMKNKNNGTDYSDQTLIKTTELITRIKL